MQYVSGNLMPLRLLEEIVYWKAQEQEHAAVVRSLIPELEPPYVQLLTEWEDVFAKTKQFAQRTKDITESESARSSSSEMTGFLPQLLEDSLSQSREFSRQLQLLPVHSTAISRMQDASIPLAYIQRQPDYFNGIMIHLERTGAINLITTQGTDDDSPEGFGGPEPADSESRETGNPVPIGGHTLPPLPYSYKALEPYIDERTMRIHHDKHHQSYVDGLNKAEKKLEEADRKSVV